MINSNRPSAIVSFGSDSIYKILRFGSNRIFENDFENDSDIFRIFGFFQMFGIYFSIIFGYSGIISQCSYIFRIFGYSSNSRTYLFGWIRHSKLFFIHLMSSSSYMNSVLTFCNFISSPSILTLLYYLFFMGFLSSI